MKIFVIILLLVLFALAVVFGPLAILWALNTLVVGMFPAAYALPYTFYNWLAVVVLNLTWMSKFKTKSRGK